MEKRLLSLLVVFLFVSLCSANEVELGYQTRYRQFVRLYEARQMDNAINEGLELLDFAKKYFGNNHEKIADISLLLGDSYKGKQKFDVSKIYYKRYIAIVSETGNLERYVTGLRKLMQLYGEMGDFQNAADTAQNIYLTDLKRSGGVENSVTVNDLINLGRYNEKLGEFSAARNFYLKALMHTGKIKTSGEVLKAEIHYGLGRVFKLMQNYSEAAAYFNSSVLLKERISKGGDPAIGKISREMAQMLIQNGNLKLAENHLKKALMYQKKKMRDNQDEISEAHMDLAGLYYLMKDYRNCEYQIKSAVMQWEKKVGVYHPKTAFYLEKLGNFYNNINEPEHSEKYLRMAEDIRKSLSNNDYRK